MSRRSSNDGSWSERLGIAVPDDLILETELMDEKQDCSGPLKTVGRFQRSTSRTYSTSSDLDEEEARELAEYMKQASSEYDLTVTKKEDVLEDLPKSDSTDIEKSSENNLAWNQLQNWKFNEATDPPNKTNSPDQEGEEENESDGADVDETDDYLGTSPPVVRNLNANHKWNSGPIRRKFQTKGRVPLVRSRNAHVSSRTSISQRREPVSKTISLPTKTVRDHVTYTRHQEERLRSRRRGHQRGAKVFNHHMMDEDIGEEFFTPPPTCPSTPPVEEEDDIPPLLMPPPSPMPVEAIQDNQLTVPQLSDFRAESLPPQLTVKVGERCRYLSVSSRRLSEPFPTGEEAEHSPLPADCLSFHAKVTSLFKGPLTETAPATNLSTLASRKMSQEELLYQQELSETLWLEIQAWHAQRDCFDFDNLLFKQRNKVFDVVAAIMNFEVASRPSNSLCPNGCLSIWCEACKKYQDTVIRQLASVIDMIDEVEGLFPSTAKMVMLYPVWGELEFTSRCRTLYLWYNTVSQLRRTILMLGTRLHHIASIAFPWPSFRPLRDIIKSPSSSNKTTSSEEDDVSLHHHPESPVKFVIGNDDDSEDDLPESDVSFQDEPPPQQPKVLKKQMTQESRGSSSSSLLSPVHTPSPSNMTSSDSLRRTSSTMFLEANPYRKYVEKCMHSKGLRKTFDKIVEVIRDVMARTVCAMDEDEHHHHNRSVNVLEEHCMELQRQLFLTHYLSNPADMFIKGPATNASTLGGENKSVPFHHLSWSGRIWCLGLPGLPNLFWFLSSVPVQLVCECLVLRLNQMPKQPSQLSIKQLMREYREGLKLAVSVRRKFSRWSSALTDHLNPTPLTNKLTRRRKSSVVSEPVTLRIPRNILTRSHTVTPSTMPFRDPRKQYSLDGWSSPYSEANPSQSPPDYSNNMPAPTPPQSQHLSSFSSSLNSQSAPSSPFKGLQRSNSDAITSKYNHRMIAENNQAMLAYQQQQQQIPSPFQHIVSPRNIESYNNSPNALPNGPVFFNPNDPNLVLHQDHSKVLTSPPPSSSVSSSAHLTPRELSGSTGESALGSVLVSASSTAPEMLKKEHTERHFKRMEELDANIEKMLKVYLDWLDLYIPVAGSNSSSHHSETDLQSHGSVLLQEWQFVTTVCPQVLHAYTLAATKFCNLAEQLISDAWDYLNNGIDELTSQLQSENLPHGEESDASSVCSPPPPLSIDFNRPNFKRVASRKEVRRLCEVVSASRKLLARSLGLAKTLREQLEVAIEYKKSSSMHTIRGVLQATGHVKLTEVDNNHVVFVPGYLASDVDTIKLLLSLTPVSDGDRTSGITSDVTGATLLNGDINGATGAVPSLLLTSPTAHSKPLLLVPPASSSVKTIGGAITPSPVHRKNSSTLAMATKRPPYVIIIKLDNKGSKSSSARRNSSIEKTEPKFEWSGSQVSIQPTAATTIALASLQECEVLVVCSSDSIGVVHHHLSNLFPPNLLTTVHNRVAPHSAVHDALTSVKDVCVDVCDKLVKSICVVCRLLRMHESTVNSATSSPSGSITPTLELNHSGPSKSTKHVHRDAMQTLFCLSFECHRDVSRLFFFSSSGRKAKLSNMLVNCSQAWMNFCLLHYPPGNGVRPRWATLGLDFLLHSCSPQHLKHLSKHTLQSFQKEVLATYEHIVGAARPSPKIVPGAPLTPGATRRQFRSSSSSVSGSRGNGSNPQTPRTPISADRIELKNLNTPPEFPTKTTGFPYTVTALQKRGQMRVRDAVTKLDHRLHRSREKNGTIGHVVAGRSPTHTDVMRAKYKTVGFSWHRGFKIGSGRFGKVYTAVNNTTGDLLAVKVQPISSHDRRTLEKLAEELKILEGLEHPHLVKYYGMEVLEEELLFFMEYCEEGSLERLSHSEEGGLPEVLVRRYTRQLLDGVSCLHDHGIIHRDIKGANIFLTKSHNHLKLGDFGCAVRLRGDHTEVGELGGIVGTHAFMAPEIYQGSKGHGRAADIWSLGCVVIEMSTGQRPWPELVNSAQIMFKVGMGQSPRPPPGLSIEGREFLAQCFVHDPAERSVAAKLFHFPFVKVELEEDCNSLPLFSGFHHVNS